MLFRSERSKQLTSDIKSIHFAPCVASVRPPLSTSLLLLSAAPRTNNQTNRMVGAPGYDSGRSVLVVVPSHGQVSTADVETVWDVFEKNGILVTFATSSSSSALPLVITAGNVETMDASLKQRLEVPVNLSSALGFRGVSYDGFLVLGGTSSRGEAATPAKDGCRIPEILLNAVKANKYIATCGDGVLALSNVSFRGRPVLKGKHVSATPALAERVELNGAEAVLPKKGHANITKDARLLTCGDPKDLRDLCGRVREILQAEDGTTYIPAYLQG